MRFCDSVKRYYSAYPNQIDDHKNVFSHGIFVLIGRTTKIQSLLFPIPDVQLAINMDIIDLY